MNRGPHENGSVRKAGIYLTWFVALQIFAISFAAADTSVTTFSGTGWTGYADGSTRQATFMLPMGLAIDGHGSLYVADAAAQRVRVVREDGTVQTLAGSGVPDSSGVWVPGGYADGNASQARFNLPAAVAVARDGRVFVADSYNHCVRVIDPNGTVSTWVGSPNRPGLSVGPRDQATFQRPSGLAIDAEDNLYVVDTGLGGSIRKVDPSGNVTDVKIGDGTLQPAGAIALFERDGRQTFFLADLSGLYVRHPDGSTDVFRNKYYALRCAAKTAPGWLSCGHPTVALRAGEDVGVFGALAAIDDHTVFGADWKTSAIRLIDVKFRTARVIAGPTRGDGSGRDAGSQDGPGKTATFNEPLGLVLDSHGVAFVADSGSRRIRRVAPIVTRNPLTVESLATMPAMVRGSLVYLGSERIWQSLDWADSIEGRLEARLRGGKCALCNAAIVPVVVERPADIQRSLDLAARGGARAVIIQVPSSSPSSLAPDPVTFSAIESIVHVPPRLHIVVVAVPSAAELGMLPAGDDPTSVHASRPDLSAIRRELRNKGATLLDLSPEFREVGASQDGLAVYDYDGTEFTMAGRVAIATAISRAFESGL